MDHFRTVIYEVTTVPIPSLRGWSLFLPYITEQGETYFLNLAWTI